MGDGGARQQIGGAVLSVGGGVLAVLVKGTAGITFGVLLVLIGLWLVIEPVSPWMLPVARVQDGLGRTWFRPQIPRLRQQRRIRRTDLRNRASALSTQIFTMVGEHRRTDPARHPHWHAPGWDAMSEEDRNAVFRDNTEKMIDHSTELMTRYNVECSVEAMALHDEFQRLGVTDGQSRHYFEHPTNPLGLEEVARSLGVWAKKV